MRKDRERRYILLLIVVLLTTLLLLPAAAQLKTYGAWMGPDGVVTCTTGLFFGDTLIAGLNCRW